MVGRTTQKSHHDVFCHQYPLNPAAALFDDNNAQSDYGDDDTDDDDDCDDDDDDDDDQNPETDEPMFIFIYHSTSLV